MRILKEILFWWMLIDNTALCLFKSWRKFRIEELTKLDK